MNISRLYKIDNKVIFYASNLNTTRQETFNGLNDGSKIGYATDGSILDPEEAANNFLIMCDYQVGTTNIEKIYRNIELSKLIIAVVKSEILEYENGIVYLVKLQETIVTLQTGSFFTASQLLSTVERDEVLTDERLLRWSEMCISADSLD